MRHSLEQYRFFSVIAWSVVGIVTIATLILIQNVSAEIASIEEQAAVHYELSRPVSTP